MSADPEVMEFFPAPLTRAESDAFVDRTSRASPSAAAGAGSRVQERASGAFVGVAGLAPVRFEAHFTPAVEIGWRLARAAWGKGFATEAARASVDVRVRRARPRRGRRAGGAGERAVAGRHAPARHDARPGRRLRPAGPAREQPAAPPRPLPADGRAVGVAPRREAVTDPRP